ncbi:LamG-like jellyroll fold domain-containing protein [archaeon]
MKWLFVFVIALLLVTVTVEALGTEITLKTSYASADSPGGGPGAKNVWRDRDGFYHIIFHDGTNDKLYYTYSTSTEPTSAAHFITPVIIFNSAERGSMWLDVSSGIIHLAYAEVDASPRLVYAKCDTDVGCTSGWTSVGTIYNGQTYGLASIVYQQYTDMVTHYITHFVYVKDTLRYRVYYRDYDTARISPYWGTEQIVDNLPSGTTQRYVHPSIDRDTSGRIHLVTRTWVDGGALSTRKCLYTASTDAGQTWKNLAGSVGYNDLLSSNYVEACSINVPSPAKSSSYQVPHVAIEGASSHTQWHTKGSALTGGTWSTPWSYYTSYANWGNLGSDINGNTFYSYSRRNGVVGYVYARQRNNAGAWQTQDTLHASGNSAHQVMEAHAPLCSRGDIGVLYGATGTSTLYFRTIDGAYSECNTPPTLSSVTVSTDPIQGGGEQTVTPSGQGDADSDPLKFVCCIGEGASCTPTTGNTVCNEGQTTYSSPYSSMTCTYDATAGATQSEAAYCRTYDGTEYHMEVGGANDAYDVDSDAPVTTDNGVADNCYGGDWSLTLSPTDAGAASVDWTKYCVDDVSNDCTPSTTGTSVPTDCGAGNACDVYVRYQSQDTVGNLESVKSSGNISIDRAPPNPSSITGIVPSAGQLAVTASQVTDVGCWGDNWYYFTCASGACNDRTWTLNDWTHTDVGLAPATEFCYTITVRDGATNTGSASSQVCGITPGNQPTSMSATASIAAPLNSERGNVDLSWSANSNPGGTIYSIERDQAWIANTTSTTYTDTAGSDNTEYCYRVRAAHPSGSYGSYSTEECAMTADRTSPATPSLTAAADNVLNQVNLSWDQGDDNLVGYWPFEEGSGSSTDDWSPAGGDGTLQGPDWISGQYGRALDFVLANTDYVDVPSGALLDLSAGTNSFTIVGWINPDLSQDVGPIISTRDVINGVVTKGYGFETNINTANGMKVNSLRLVLGTPAWKWNVWGSETNSLVPGSWQHVAVVVTGTNTASKTVQFYIDGVESNTYYWTASTETDVLLWGDNPLSNRIGGYYPATYPPYGVGYFDGSIDELRVYAGKAFTQEEIFNDMESGLITHGVHRGATSWEYGPADGLADNFSDGDYTNDPTWTVPVGTWAVSSEKLTQSFTGGGWTKITAGSSSWDDYVFSVKVKPTTITETYPNVGLMLRAQNSNTYYGIFHHQDDNTWRVYDYQDAAYIFTSSAMSLAMNEWHELKAKVVGDNLKFYVDGVLVADLTDSTMSTGYIGLLTLYTAAEFDDIKVTPLIADDEYGDSGAADTTAPNNGATPTIDQIAINSMRVNWGTSADNGNTWYHYITAFDDEGNEDNIFHDGGCEKGTNPCYFKAGSLVSSGYTVDSSVAYTGGYSVRQDTSSSTKYFGSDFIIGTDIEPNTDYIAECMVKTALSAGYARIYPEHQFTTLHFNSVSGTTDWTRIHTSFTSGASGDVRLLRYTMGTATGQTWWDDCTLHKLTETTVTTGVGSDDYYVYNTVGSGDGGTNSSWQATPYTDTSLSANTQYCYKVRARDNAGTPNVGDFGSQTCKWTLPEDPDAICTSGHVAGTWSSNNDPSFTIDGDANAYHYDWNGASSDTITTGDSTITSPHTFTDTADGTWYLHLISANPDGAVNPGGTQTFSVGGWKIDATAPTSVSTSGGTAGWQNTAASAGVSCSDATSGCDTSTYRVYNRGSAGACDTNYATYTQTVPYSVTSQQWICAAAKDNAGNVKYQGTATEFQVDMLDPTTSDNADTVTCHNIDQTVTLTPGDTGGSGLADTDYCVDTGNSCTPTTSGTSASVTCADGGYCQQYVRYFSTDTAGNTETVNSVGTIKIDKAPPSTPSITVITPGSQQIALTSSVVSDVGCEGGVQYYFDCVSGACNDRTWASGNTYTDTGLADNTYYCYKVKAKDANNKETVLSAQQCAWTTTPAPTLDSVTAEEDGLLVAQKDSLLIDWTGNGATSYDLERTTDTTTVYSGGNTDYTDLNLDDNSEYCYHVRGVDGGGTPGSWSSTVCGINADRTGPTSPVYNATGTQGNPATDCVHILEERGAVASGVYWIDPLQDGGGFEVYCDMLTDGGGWTLVDNDAVNAEVFLSREPIANTDPGITAGKYLQEWAWGPQPRLMVKSSVYNGDLNWVTLIPLTAFANEYPTVTTQPTSEPDAWAADKLNGNMWNDGGSWIYSGSGRFGSVWIGNGGAPTAACNYASTKVSGLGTYANGDVSTCSTWVRPRDPPVPANSVSFEWTQGDSNLVLYMPFEEGTGAATDDWSSSENDGTKIGTWTTGNTDTYTGGALNFGGSSEYVNIPYDASLAPDQLTVMAWFNADAFVNNQRIVSKTEGGGYQLSINEAACPGEVCMLVHTGSYHVVSYAHSNLNTGQWHHMTGTYDGSTAKLYIDGVEVDSNSNPSGNIVYNANNPLCVGAEATSNSCGGGYQFLGEVDEVRVYDTALTQREIIDAMQSGVIGHGVLRADNNAGGATYTPVGGLISATSGTLAPEDYVQDFWLEFDSMEDVSGGEAWEVQFKDGGAFEYIVDRTSLTNVRLQNTACGGTQQSFTAPIGQGVWENIDIIKHGADIMIYQDNVFVGETTLQSCNDPFDTITISGEGMKNIRLVPFNYDNEITDTVAKDETGPNTPSAPTVTAVSTSSLSVDWTEVTDNGDDWFHVVTAWDDNGNDDNILNNWPSIKEYYGLAGYPFWSDATLRSSGRVEPGERIMIQFYEKLHPLSAADSDWVSCYIYETGPWANSCSDSSAATTWDWGQCNRIVGTGGTDYVVGCYHGPNNEHTADGAYVRDLRLRKVHEETVITNTKDYYVAGTSLNAWYTSGAQAAGSLSSNTQYCYTVKARDNGLNEGTASGSGCKYTLPVDPTFSVSHTASQWSADDTVEFTVSNSDGATYYYVWDQNPGTNPTGGTTWDGTLLTKTATADGNNWYLHVVAENPDNAQNPNGAEHLGPYFIDTTGPSSVSTTGAPAGWQNTDASASVSCSDASSLCDSATYRVYNRGSAGACSTTYGDYTQTVAYSVTSQQWICAAAKDNVGNTAYQATATEFMVDKTAPGAPALTVVQYTSATCPTFQWDEAVDTGGSGIKDYELEVARDNNTWVTDPVGLDNDGFDTGWIAQATYCNGVSCSYTPSTTHECSAGMYGGGTACLCQGAWYWRVRARDASQNEGPWAEEE